MKKIALLLLLVKTFSLTCVQPIIIQRLMCSLLKKNVDLHGQGNTVKCDITLDSLFKKYSTYPSPEHPKFYIKFYKEKINLEWKRIAEQIPSTGC